MNTVIDRDEVKVILDLYRSNKIELNQALNLLGYEGPNMKDTGYPGVEWPVLNVKNPNKPLFSEKELSDKPKYKKK